MNCNTRMSESDFFGLDAAWIDSCELDRSVSETWANDVGFYEGQFRLRIDP